MQGQSIKLPNWRIGLAEPSAGLARQARALAVSWPRRRPPRLNPVHPQPDLIVGRHGRYRGNPTYSTAAETVPLGPACRPISEFP